MLASGALSAPQEQALDERWEHLHPLRLKLELEAAQRMLAARAVQPTPAAVRSEDL